MRCKILRFAGFFAVDIVGPVSDLSLGDIPLGKTIVTTDLNVISGCEIVAWDP